MPDVPPTVSIVQPAQHLFATPGAVVPLEITAHDDVGLRWIGLSWTRSDQPQSPNSTGDPAATQKIYDGPPQPPRLAAGQTPASTPGESRTVKYAGNWARSACGRAWSWGSRPWPPIIGA